MHQPEPAASAEIMANLTARLAAAERALAARDKTVQALITREKDRTAKRHSTFEVMEQDATLQQVVARKTLELETQNARLSQEIAIRKEVEAALAKNKEKHRQLFAASREALFTLFPPDWKFTSANAATITLFGVKHELDFIARELKETSPERQPDGELSSVKAQRMITTAMESGSHFFDWTHQRINGEVFPATVMLTRVESEGRLGLQAAVRDMTEQRRAEQKLRQSEERVRAIADSAQDAILMMDPEGRASYWNPAAERILGYTSSEVLGQNLHDLIAPARFLPAHYAAFPVFQQTGQGAAVGKTLDLEVRRKDGQEISVQLSLSAIQMNDGWHAVGLIRDITERKRTEEKLRQLSQAMEQSPASVVITDTAGNIEYVNPKFIQITGYTLAEVLGKNPRVLKSGETSPEAYRELWQTITAGKEWRGEFHNKRKNGELYWEGAFISPVKDLAGRVTHFVAVKEDINARKQAEAALRESKHFAESIAENSTSTIYVFDLETRRTVYANHNAGESLGYSPAQIIELGENLLPTIMHPEDLPRIAQQLARFAGVPDSRVLDIEYRVKHASGDWHWMWARETVFNRRPNGTPRQILGTAQDITERKRAQAELENVHKELVEASRRGGMAEIATNVLHNVGNVLNSVNISVGLIVESVKKSRVASLARVVGLLREHAPDLGAFITQDPKGKHVPAHLAQLAEHLLADQEAMVSELDALRRNVEHIKEIVAMQQKYATFGGVKEMIDVVNLVEDSLRMNEGAFGRHGVEVIREFEPVPLLNVEKHKILQILVNLLRNAKYACDESERADRRLTVRVANDESRVKISVMDNGIGIPPENLTRIFNHGFTTRKGGHGFGLHSGALAAKEMGGSLTVHSDGPGQGAVFTLELPSQTREN